MKTHILGAGTSLEQILLLNQTSKQLEQCLKVNTELKATYTSTEFKRVLTTYTC